MAEPRIQDFYPEAFRGCFGCGRDNPEGLRLDTRVEGDRVVSRWEPEARLRGPTATLHGGVVAVLMDEVASAAAFVEFHRQRAAALGSVPDLDFVTAALSVDFLAPAPMDRTLTISGRAEEASGRKVWVRCEIADGDTVVARGRLLFVSLDPRRRARLESESAARLE